MNNKIEIHSDIVCFLKSIESGNNDKTIRNFEREIDEKYPDSSTTARSKIVSIFDILVSYDLYLEEIAQALGKDLLPPAEYRSIVNSIKSKSA